MPVFQLSKHLGLVARGLFVFGFLFPVRAGLGQELPKFYKEVQAFKKQDSLQFPAPGQVLFIGSSSFTRWTDVQQYFPGVPILNRGFGGSALHHIIYYQDDIIYPYKPSQVVIYCGENDFTDDATVITDTVVLRFKRLFYDIRARLPGVPVVFISLKPSPSRMKLMLKYEITNFEIREFLRKQKKTRFIDVYRHMLLPDGRPNGALFVDDSLHMNAQGYKIWQQKLAPVLKAKRS